MAEALFATQRRAERSTRAAEAFAVAEALGFAPLPWQRQVLDVALEVDDAGALAWRNVSVSTPRQQAKSTTCFVLILWRLLSMDDQTIVFGAQSRMEARHRMLDVWWPRLLRSPFAERLEVSRGAGFEAIRCDNGSILKLLSSEQSSAHGLSVDLAVVDECWSLDEYVEQAVRPATLARPEPQLWFTSTAGTSQSTWWNSKVEAGRRAVVDGSDTSAHFEWSAPVDADPADPATWRACMPALGHTVSEEAVRADFEVLPLPQFIRGYLNRVADGDDAGWRLVTQETWEAAAW